VDFAQMRDFQSGFEYLSRSKTFLHSLGRNRRPRRAAIGRFLPVATGSNGQLSADHGY
jgi:hypothetical protein